MSIFDIVGPIMIGPSSSHTAGANRIGYIARRLLQEPVAYADILLHGSFLDTGQGHGTDKAIVAGLMLMKADDLRIPQSLDIAKKSGIHVNFSSTELKNAHPNSVLLRLTGKNGRTLEVIASSTGGGRIKINKIDGLTANFCGDYPTLVVQNSDQTGVVAKVTSMLAKDSVNIATMQLYRDKRGGNAMLIIECDQEVNETSLQWLKERNGVLKVTYLSLQNREGKTNGISSAKGD